MKESAEKSGKEVKYLKDYTKPSHKVDQINLEFILDDEKTLVTSTMKLTPLEGSDSLVLNGEEILLKSVECNSNTFSSYEEDKENNLLKLSGLPADSFELKIISEINPKENTSLDGLYKSSGMFCTQNEPEGFRRITYYIDRPDTLSVFTTKIVADKDLYPHLLANGNLIESGNVSPEEEATYGSNKHYAIWNDPFAKPCYLFALVAGDLAKIEDTYTTCSGRNVKLEVFVDKGNESKATYALESLKNSMKWDEERFGLEYDLDIYMIVAVDSFNMGAMENKGLNIFNSAYVLADQDTAEDENFFGIESVVGHEYFHNWTGNRVTCRDWFQLTLKEGLTVFRDQEFSADLNSRAVCRINDVKRLRQAQFPEDAGPMAHPIKPKSYIEMNNFYTMTIYEKGAEVIRMIHTLLGEDGFRKGMDKYFELFDGQAVTTEDFVHAMSVANDNYDFGQFGLWYDQLGTPVVNVEYTQNQDEMILKVNQSCPKNEEVNGKGSTKPYHMPLDIGFVSKTGDDVSFEVLEGAKFTKLGERNIFHLNENSHVIKLKLESAGEVVPSLNRQFSAPVKLESNLSIDNLIHLMAFDKDEFNRYESGQTLTRNEIYACYQSLCEGINVDQYQFSDNYLNAWGEVLKDSSIEDHYKGVCLAMPTMTDISAMLPGDSAINYPLIHNSIKALKLTLSKRYESELVSEFTRLDTVKEFKVDASSMGNRFLKKVITGYLANLDRHSEGIVANYYNANNMTDRRSAMNVIVAHEMPQKDEVLKDFYGRYKDQTLVMQKWLGTQAQAPGDSTYETVLSLLDDEVYDKTMPNCVRALVGTFAANKVQFMHESGRGLKLVAEKVKEYDKINPQMTSRLARAFSEYKRMPKALKDLTKELIEEILSEKSLSKNVYEILSKTLN